jgi:hypothetical protein
MSPRTELVAIELFDSIAELKELFIKKRVILRLWYIKTHWMILCEA